MSKDTKKRNRSAERIANANAKTATAQAQAAAAQAEAARINADLERQRLADQAAKRGFDIGVTAATYGIGLAGGKMLASSVDKKIAASLAARNAALADLAKAMKPLTAKSGGTSPVGQRSSAQINAAAKVGRKTGITRPGRGAAGLITGVGMIGMGAYTRSLGANSTDPTEKTIYTALGTAEIVAGGTVLYSDLVSRQAPKALPDVKALATIAQAEAVATRSTPALPAKTPAPTPAAQVPAPKTRAANVTQRASKAVTAANKASKAMVGGMSMAGRAAAATGGLLKRVALPAVAGIAALGAMQGAAQAGESTAVTVKAGALAATDVVTGGAVTFYGQAREQGYSQARSFLEGAVRGTANFLTLGVVQDKLAVPLVEPVAQKAENKPKGLSGGDVLNLAVAGAMVGAGASFISDGNRAARYGRGALRVAGNRAAGLTLLTLAAVKAYNTVTGALKPEKPAPAAKPTTSASVSSARLTLARADAARTSTAMAQRSVAVSPRTMQQAGLTPGRGGQKAKAAKPGPDTFAEGYTRVVDGRAQQVRGYHITPRRA